MTDLPGFNPPLTDEQIAENVALQAKARLDDWLAHSPILGPSMPGLSAWDRFVLGLSPEYTHDPLYDSPYSGLPHKEE